MCLLSAQPTRSPHPTKKGCWKQDLWIITILSSLNGRYKFTVFLNGNFGFEDMKYGQRTLARRDQNRSPPNPVVCPQLLPKDAWGRTSGQANTHDWAPCRKGYPQHLPFVWGATSSRPALDLHPASFNCSIIGGFTLTKLGLSLRWSRSIRDIILQS